MPALFDCVYVTDTLNCVYVTETFAITGVTLYLNDDLADFHFIFRSESPDGVDDDLCKRLPAHKILLATSSDVFKKMFTDSWNGKDDVEIVDASANAFKEFLQFFYYNHVILTMKNVYEVMNLGKKYNVTECLTTCEKLLRNNLSDDDVCFAYEAAIRLDRQDLKNYCETVICVNTKAIFATETFLNCERETVSHILKLEFLGCTETETFEALIKWIKAAVKQDVLTKEIVRDQFGDLFQGIRFGSMTLKEFLELDYVDYLLSYSEYRDIVKEIALPSYQSKTYPRKNIKDIKLGGMVKCDRLVNVAQDLEDQEYIITDLDNTKFSSSEPLLLKIFVFPQLWEWCEGEYQHPDKVLIEVTIAQLFPGSDCEIIIHYELVKLQNHFHNIVHLSKPILIKPAFLYEIRITQTTPDLFCISYSLKEEVEIDSDTVVQFHRNPTLDESEMRTGIVYGLVFELI